MSKYPYTVVRSRRKTTGIRINDDATVTVHAPLHASAEAIEETVNHFEGWLDKHLAMVQEKIQNAPDDAQAALLIRKARAVLPGKLKFWSDKMGVKPKQMRVTSAVHRFGSCNSQGHICFSYHLMRYPDEAIDYVVVHELAHLKHMNHSRSFYHLVGQYLPDYKRREAMLRVIPEKGAGLPEEGEDLL